MIVGRGSVVRGSVAEGPELAEGRPDASNGCPPAEGRPDASITELFALYEASTADPRRG